MRNFGGMVSFRLSDEQEPSTSSRARRSGSWQRVSAVSRASSNIRRMTHASTADAPFAVPSTLIRLSVGIESAEDLIDDLESALAG